MLAIRIPATVRKHALWAVPVAGLVLWLCRDLFWIVFSIFAFFGMGIALHVATISHFYYNRATYKALAADLKADRHVDFSKYEAVLGRYTLGMQRKMFIMRGADAPRQSGVMGASPGQSVQIEAFPPGEQVYAIPYRMDYVLIRSDQPPCSKDTNIEYTGGYCSDLGDGWYMVHFVK